MSIHIRSIAAFAVACLVILSACDDKNNSLGWGQMPEYSKLEGAAQEFGLQWRTVSADMKSEDGTQSTSQNNIFVSSNDGYIGSIPNQEYGSVKCEYLTQFYCPRGFEFFEKPLDNKIDSAFIHIYYSSFTGDSIAPMEISAYRLKKPLTFSKLSVSDAKEYVSDELIGKNTYYAGRGHGVLANDQKTKVISIPISREFGQKVYDMTLKGDKAFSSQEAFDQFFPGIYIKNSAGAGSVLRVQRTALSFFFSRRDTVMNSRGVKDSVILVPRMQQLIHTAEVPQLALFQNKGLEKLLESNAEYAYIKSPAGVVSELTIPTVAIKKYLDSAPEGLKRDIASIPLILNGESQGTGTYDLGLPDNILILPKDSVASFFSKEMTEANSPFTTFLSQKSSTGSTTYNFGNITSLVKRQLVEAPTQDLKVWVIPVYRTVSSNTVSGGSQGSTTSISNLVLPSAVKFNKKNESNAKINVIFTQKKEGAPF